MTTEQFILNLLAIEGKQPTYATGGDVAKLVFSDGIIEPKET